MDLYKRRLKKLAENEIRLYCKECETYEEFMKDKRNYENQLKIYDSKIKEYLNNIHYRQHEILNNLYHIRDEILKDIDGRTIKGQEKNDLQTLYVNIVYLTEYVIESDGFKYSVKKAYKSLLVLIHLIINTNLDLVFKNKIRNHILNYYFEKDNGTTVNNTHITEFYKQIEDLNNLFRKKDNTIVESTIRKFINKKVRHQLTKIKIEREALQKKLEEDHKIGTLEEEFDNVETPFKKWFHNFNVLYKLVRLNKINFIQANDIIKQVQLNEEFIGIFPTEKLENGKIQKSNWTQNLENKFLEVMKPEYQNLPEEEFNESKAYVEKKDNILKTIETEIEVQEKNMIWGKGRKLDNIYLEEIFKKKIINLKFIEWRVKQNMIKQSVDYKILDYVDPNYVTLTIESWDEILKKKDKNNQTNKR